MSFPSALLPILETYTMPGWPESQAPGALDILWTTLLIPGAIAAVITLLTMGPAWARASRRTPGTEVERAHAEGGATRA